MDIGSVGVWWSGSWLAMLPLAFGLLVGSRIGPSITRRLPADVIRVAVAFVGLGLAACLWISPA